MELSGSFRHPSTHPLIKPHCPFPEEDSFLRGFSEHTPYGLLAPSTDAMAGHLGICWSADPLSIPVHSGNPQHCEASLAYNMGSLITPFLSQPVTTMLLTAPDAGFPGGPSVKLKASSGPVVVIKRLLYPGGGMKSQRFKR